MGSERLFQQASHLCRRLLLHLVCGVGVGGEGVPQIMEADMLQPGILEDLLMQLLVAHTIP